MAMKVNLMVDYEDQADWLQDSVLIENVENSTWDIPRCFLSLN